MAEFTLDTSGSIPNLYRAGAGYPQRMWWSDLDAFTQGYVEALLVSMASPPNYWGHVFVPRYTDLVPETLAAILLDCARAQRLGVAEQWGTDDRRAGAAFWALQSITQTPYLGDDGKFYLRKIQHDPR
jgi:hypothetical protein